MVGQSRDPSSLEATDSALLGRIAVIAFGFGENTACAAVWE